MTQKQMNIGELERLLGLSIPLCIREKVKGLPFVMDKVGMSHSHVALFDDYVLKISSLSFDIENEPRVYRALKGKIPIPDILECVIEGGRIYILKNKLQGKMLCDDYYMNRPELLYALASEALHMLWSIDVRGLELQNTFDTIISFGRELEGNGGVELADLDPGTIKGFSNFSAILSYLIQNKPKDDLVLAHGDLCLPNIICDQDRIVGFIDVGLMGVSSRYHDLAILYRSIRNNFAGYYGKPYPGYDDEKLFRLLGTAKDEKQLDYYLLLDEVLG